MTSLDRSDALTQFGPKLLGPKTVQRAVVYTAGSDPNDKNTMIMSQANIDEGVKDTLTKVNELKNTTVPSK